jgi:hypothetical protein
MRMKETTRTMMRWIWIECNGITAFCGTERKVGTTIQIQRSIYQLDCSSHERKVCFPSDFPMSSNARRRGFASLTFVLAAPC